MFKTLKQDLARISSPTFLAGLRCYFIPRGECFPYVFWLRILQSTRRHSLTRILFGLPVYLIYRHFEFKYGIHANANTTIGPGFRPVHGPCNLNAASIGSNFTVYSGVTIGIHKGGVPTIGDNVSIFPNSVVCGPITIGSNATIGALSYVSHSLPEGVKFHSSTSTSNFDSFRHSSTSTSNFDSLSSPTPTPMTYTSSQNSQPQPPTSTSPTPTPMAFTSQT